MGFRRCRMIQVTYQVSAFYRPEYARGVRWDDPLFNIRWPDGERIILERDRSFPNFVPDLVRRA